MNPIDWTEVFNWKMWQVVKWLLGSIIVIVLLVLLFREGVYKSKYNDLETKHQETVTVIEKLIYDTRVPDKTVIQLIGEFLDKTKNKTRGDINKQKE